MQRETRRHFSLNMLGRGVPIWWRPSCTSLNISGDRPGLWSPCMMWAGRGWGCPNGGGQVSKDWACSRTMARARDPCMVWEAAGAWCSLYGATFLPDTTENITFFSLPAKKNHSVGKYCEYLFIFPSLKWPFVVFVHKLFPKIKKKPCDHRRQFISVNHCSLVSSLIRTACGFQIFIFQNHKEE